MRRPRRAAPAVCLASIATSTAVSPAQEPPEYNAKGEELDCRVERVTSPWEIIDVKRDRRALKLVYESGGCLRRDGHATVTETASTIEIAADLHFIRPADRPGLPPRSLGLAAQDARAMLKANGIEVTGARRGRVVKQVPAPGKRVGPEGVRLSVSR